LYSEQKEEGEMALIVTCILIVREREREREREKERVSD